MTLPYILRQAVALDVDTDARRFSGHTELEVEFPSEATSIGLHACGLAISSVTLDGADCPFELALTPAPGPLPRELAEDAQQQQQLSSSSSSNGNSVATVVAEAAAFSYASVLHSRERPELLVRVPPEDESALNNRKRGKAMGRRDSGAAAEEQQQMEVDGNNGNEEAAAKPPRHHLLRRATLRVRYAVATPDPRSGLRFWGSSGAYAHTTPAEPYGARSWLPTVDDPRASFPLDTRVTVLETQTAIAPGVLRRLRPAPARKDDKLKRKRRTFVFECSLAMPASMAAVVVGPYCRVDDGEEDPGGRNRRTPSRRRSGASVSCFAPPPAAPLLRFAAASLKLALDAFEGYLGAPPPGGALHVVFVPAEAAPPRHRPGSAAAPAVGGCLLLTSTDALFGPRQGPPSSVEARLALARGAAGAWFGSLLRPADGDADGWVLDGVARHLESQLFASGRLGLNESRWRSRRARSAVIRADDGVAPPLCLKEEEEEGEEEGEEGGKKGGGGGGGDQEREKSRARLFASPTPPRLLRGTELLDPSPLRHWKACEVVAMLERRAGGDAFRRVLQRMVTEASQAAEAEKESAAADEENAADGGGGGGREGGAAAATTTAATPALSLPAPSLAAASATAAAAAAKSKPLTRLVGARDFVLDVARAGGFRKDAAPFFQRYVAGSGAPALVAAFTYHRKRHVLEVAIRQSGSPAAARAAAAAEAAASKEGSSVGLVRLAVREPAGYAEHLLHVGTAPTVLAELRVTPPIKKSMKAVAGRRMRREESAEPGEGEGDEDGEGGGGGGDGEEGQLAGGGAAGFGGGAGTAASNKNDDDALDVPDGQQVVWVRLNPGNDMLAASSVLQGEWMFSQQLAHSRDAAAQAEAVAGLAALRPTTHGVVSLLAGALENSALHCRVRADAAAALASTAFGGGGGGGGASAAGGTGGESVGAAAMLSSSFLSQQQQHFTHQQQQHFGVDETEGAGLDRLLRWFRRSTTATDPAGNPLPRPLRALAADAPLSVVLSAAARAIGRARDREGRSPDEAVDALCDVLLVGGGAGSPPEAPETPGSSPSPSSSSSSFAADAAALLAGGGPASGDDLVAALLSALGDARPRSPSVVRRAASAVDRWLARDAACPSFQRVVGRAAVGAAAALVVAAAVDFSRDSSAAAATSASISASAAAALARLRSSLDAAADPGAYHLLRAAAAAARVEAEGALLGPDAAVAAAADSLALDRAPSVRSAALEALLASLRRSWEESAVALGCAGGQQQQQGWGGRRSAGVAAAATAAAAPPPLPPPPPPARISPSSLRTLFSLLSAPDAPPAEAHLAFMALRVAGGKPPTLFRSGAAVIAGGNATAAAAEFAPPPAQQELQQLQQQEPVPSPFSGPGYVGEAVRQREEAEQQQQQQDQEQWFVPPPLPGDEDFAADDAAAAAAAAMPPPPPRFSPIPSAGGAAASGGATGGGTKATTSAAKRNRGGGAESSGGGSGGRSATSSLKAPVTLRFKLPTPMDPTAAAANEGGGALQQQPRPSIKVKLPSKPSIKVKLPAAAAAAAVSRAPSSSALAGGEGGALTAAEVSSSGGGGVEGPSTTAAAPPAPPKLKLKFSFGAKKAGSVKPEEEEGAGAKGDGGEMMTTAAAAPVASEAEAAPVAEAADPPPPPSVVALFPMETTGDANAGGGGGEAPAAHAVAAAVPAEAAAAAAVPAGGEAAEAAAAAPPPAPPTTAPGPEEPGAPLPQEQPGQAGEEQEKKVD